ncbi:hypothetical protein A3D77_04640 [Candidatus Gottesmanbacteria bacterium RIFCSPHIGHO2_02_FULL_39_11]|uniref:O-antigen ligase-related domain-containing protein n=1 Tax=Candidatus Gottesmanbacteria bacterium RIFCSPHIGHO2_02_FULL_39_11 TaxID=1798382 RepID=A0A1F5ZKH9_9BACT|nr:MAG: hypothetical protein A3D77_04640 [Candidatus Gottesmanbacteria bacterium RIFCSPHIGHO2_02_FULL_39_11]
MLLLFLLFLGIIAGVAGSISIIDTVRISCLDIVVFISFLYSLFNFRKIIPILKRDSISDSFLLFLLIALISLILTPLTLTPIQFFISFLYIVRIVLYFSVYPTLKLLINEDRIKKNDIHKTIVRSGLVLCVIGWIGYFLYPDLRNLSYLGWDPHYKRIFSTFLDPNFLGIYLVICLAVLLNEWKLKSIFSILLLIATIFFTYSRSSLAALMLLGILCVWRTGKRILFIPIISLFIVGLFFLPRPGGEGVRLERLFTISQRLDHARLGLSIFFSHPILGVGFDTVRYAKAGMENSQMWLISHAGAGLDITFLFILATSGIIGFTFFIRFLYFIFLKAPGKIKIILLLVLFHSSFENSFFYPFVFLALWMEFASIYSKKTEVC